MLSQRPADQRDYPLISIGTNTGIGDIFMTTAAFDPTLALPNTTGVNRWQAETLWETFLADRQYGPYRNTW
jgi:hypothetical protein